MSVTERLGIILGAMLASTILVAAAAAAVYGIVVAVAVLTTALGPVGAMLAVLAALLWIGLTLTFIVEKW